MTTVAIIGAGDLGGSTAHALARREIVARILLVDTAAAAASGKALDIQQSGAIDGFHTRIEGTADVSRVAGSAVCVVADRFGSGGEWRGEEGLAHLSRLAPYVGDGVLLCAGVLQADLLSGAVREAGYRRERVVGSAAEA